MPTLLGACGVPVPDGLQGRDVSSVWCGEAAPHDTRLTPGGSDSVFLQNMAPRLAQNRHGWVGPLAWGSDRTVGRMPAGLPMSAGRGCSTARAIRWRWKILPIQRQLDLSSKRWKPGFTAGLKQPMTHLIMAGVALEAFFNSGSNSPILTGIEVGA